MRTRAFIFDIYNTLLEVRPPPPDAEARWLRLCQEVGGQSATLTLGEFNARCREEIAKDHALARSQGMAFPEVFWPSITCRALPGLERLPINLLDDFLYEHAQLERTVGLMAGAGEVLKELRQRGAWLGLCSNSQPYTLRELARALASAGLDMTIFDPKLCLYSFQAGFSKPDRKVFQGLARELAARSIPLSEALFVGDRLDNDIRPAQSEGWPAWHLAADSKEAMGGDWFALRRYVLNDETRQLGC